MLLKDFGKGEYWCYCPGCNEKHVFYTSQEKTNGHVWQFNGNLENPTFMPSLLLRWGKNAEPTWQEPKEFPPDNGWSGICHLFITNGKIVYCQDSTHTLAGQTVDMLQIESL